MMEEEGDGNVEWIEIEIAKADSYCHSSEFTSNGIPRRVAKIVNNGLSSSPNKIGTGHQKS